MLHCLAYGNSDQASFRHPGVRDCFDILTVPSTIASYYSDATAAFVLSSGLKYMIEPRTPLFQEWLQEPRASHYTLADVMGSSVKAHLGEPRKQGPNPSAYFSPAFYSLSVCEEVVSSMVEFQRQYGGRAEQVSAKLDRYRELLRKATGGERQIRVDEDSRGPVYVLCPYFAVRSLADKWWDVMGRIWNAAEQVEDPTGISPVVSMSDVSLLKDAIEGVPDSLSSRVFFWIPGFDERHAGLSQLAQLREVVTDVGTNHQLMNLYGGYFSILMGKFGLDGFNNGLGYSESRDWPTLDATGAAPARYYVRRLHAYVPTATATAIVETDETFVWECSVCGGSLRLPNDLSYHELKRHFALARAWEMEQAEATSLQDLCTIMRDDAARAEALKRALPSNLRIPTDYLPRWAEALGS